MKIQWMISIVVIALITLACGTTSTNAVQTAVAQTQAAASTQAAAQVQPIATETTAALSIPAIPPTPTKTPVPTLVPTPTSVVVSVEMLTNALVNSGYSNNPIEDQALHRGVSASMFYKANPYNQVILYDDGFLRLQALTNTDPAVRTSEMEAHFEVLDQLYPESFMSDLRAAFETYNSSSTGRISGNAVKTWALGDEWSNVYAKYQESITTVGAIPVSQYLWFWQISCPEGYICWMTDFPGEVFLGDNSYTFLELQFSITP